MAKEKREHYEKIIKKEKDGVTILFFHPKKAEVKCTWEEFNEVYEIRKDEPFHAYMKKEYSEKVKKSNEYFGQAFVHFMRLNAMKEDDPKRLAVQYVWFELVKKGGECLGIDPDSGECVKLFQNYCQMNLHQMVDIGVGVGGPSANMLDKKHKKKNSENMEKFEEERQRKEEERKQKEEKDTYTYRPFENAFNKNK